MWEIIEFCKIDKKTLAFKMNMSLETFCKKLDPKHLLEFTEDENVHLKALLKDLSGGY